MLHFIADLVENNSDYSSVKGFVDDLRPAERARRVASDDLNKNMNNFEKEIKKLEQNVINVSKLQNPDKDDEFATVMSEFLEVGSSELKLCQTLKSTLDAEYEGLSNYLCFDLKKNPIESKKIRFLRPLSKTSPQVEIK